MNRRAPRSLVAVTALVYLFLHLPAFVLMLFSFNRSRFSVEWTGGTLEWYRRLADRTDILRALRASVIVGLSATLVATALGTLIALGLARRRFRGRQAYEAMLYLPIVTPEIVVGISLLVLFAALGVPLGLTTITIAHVAFSISFVVVVVLARLRGMDGTLEEAAMSLGADELTAFRRVTLPQLWPAIAAAALLAFTLSFDDFVITFFVSGVGSTTLPLLVYAMVRRSIEPTVNAISTIILLVTTLLVFAADRLAVARAPRPRRRTAG
ncbi:MAG: ABC transporter permease [Gemmatimonadales bacterium]|nr:ABC transporter permease [Gemmatimonadales bacterium]